MGKRGPKRRRTDEERQPPRRFFGTEMQLRREELDFTQESLAARMCCSSSLVAMWESGARLPGPEDTDRLDQLLGTGGFLSRLRRQTLARFAAHFQEASEAELIATAIHDYAPTLVPGIFQTEDYAREVFTAFAVNPVADDVEDKTRNRIERGRILDAPDGPEIWAVLHETVLRTEVGGPAVMAAQLRKIARLGRSGRARIQVLPFRAGAHAMMSSMLRLMRFEEAPELAYVEGLYTGNIMDDPALVKRCRDAYDLARATALSPAASLDLIESIAEDYDHASEASD